MSAVISDYPCATLGKLPMCGGRQPRSLTRLGCVEKHK
jgi:hypothetical protein